MDTKISLTILDAEITRLFGEAEENTERVDSIRGISGTMYSI